MKPVTLFLARRYLFHSAYEKNIAVMVRITFLSIFIGTFSLALVTAIMRGFEVSTHQKLQTIHPQVLISSDRQELNVSAITNVIKKEFPLIVGASPWAQQHALIQHAQTENQPTVIVLKGIDPAREEQVTAIGQKITHPVGKNLSHAVTSNALAIGKKLAQELEVTVGDTTDLFYLDDMQTKKRKVTLDTTPVTIGAIFDTGIEEFDTTLAFCTLPFLQSLFPDTTIQNIGLKFAPNTNEQIQIDKLHKRLNLDVYSWKKLYPALMSARVLEKYAMIFILLLITCVAMMNMISLLFTQITQKRSDIAILLAMGARPAQVARIFFLMGMIISCAATIAGLCAAVAACFFLERYPFITLPDIYYVTHLPAHMSMTILCVVFASIMAISLFAVWLATRSIKTINVCCVLRFE